MSEIDSCLTSSQMATENPWRLLSSYPRRNRKDVPKPTRKENREPCKLSLKFINSKRAEAHATKNPKSPAVQQCSPVHTPKCTERKSLGALQLCDLGVVKHDREALLEKSIQYLGALEEVKIKNNFKTETANSKASSKSKTSERAGGKSLEAISNDNSEPSQGTNRLLLHSSGSSTTPQKSDMVHIINDAEDQSKLGLSRALNTCHSRPPIVISDSDDDKDDDCAFGSDSESSHVLDIRRKLSFTLWPVSHQKHNNRQALLDLLDSSEDNPSPPPLSERIGLTPESSSLKHVQLRTPAPSDASPSLSRKIHCIPTRPETESEQQGNTDESDKEFEEFLKSMKASANTPKTVEKSDVNSFIQDSSSDENSDEDSLHLALDQHLQLNEMQQVSTPCFTRPGQIQLSTCPKLKAQSHLDGVFKTLPNGVAARRGQTCPPRRIKHYQPPHQFSDKNIHSCQFLEKKPQKSFLASLNSNVVPTDAHPEALIFKKDFKNQKDMLVKNLYALFNERIFGQKLPSDMSVTWNPRLRKTAGYCYYKKDCQVTLGRIARIELSSKVLDTPDRVRDTLVHEMCHAASWIIHGYRDGHGPLWKFWAQRATSAFPELPPISRCHGYEVTTKYTYKCMKCKGCINRHSKSLDINRKICGRCGGRFELIVNSKPSSKQHPLASTPKTPTGFALYVKENYATIKKSNTQLKHGDIMRILSADFSANSKASM